MLNLDKVFGNLFNSRSIIALRLLIFGKDVLVNMNANNATHVYDAQIAVLSPLVAGLEKEVTSLDSAVNLRSGQTDEVDAIAALFLKTMSAQEGVIADKFGGKEKLGYKEFYPLHLKDYNAANRTTLPILTKRVSSTALKYTTILGVPLTTLLQSFFTDYTAARTTQATTIGTVGSTRNARTTADLNLEIALTGAVHFVAGQHPGDVVTCSKFVNFKLLYSAGNHKHTTLKGVLIISEIKEIANQLFTDNWSIIVRNKGVNAAIEIWLGANEDETVALKSIIIQPGNASVLKPSDLGALINPYLLMKNLSAVNPATYEVVIIG